MKRVYSVFKFMNDVTFLLFLEDFFLIFLSSKINTQKVIWLFNEITIKDVLLITRGCIYFVTDISAKISVFVTAYFSCGENTTSLCLSCGKFVSFLKENCSNFLRKWSRGRHITIKKFLSFNQTYSRVQFFPDVVDTHKACDWILLSSFLKISSFPAMSNVSCSVAFLCP